jgi:pimeloyl-ACP methyl ester carboxylesterase
MMRKMLGMAGAAGLLLAGLALAPSGAGAQDDTDVPPMIFVHGGLGSGQQFEAQALRFASNGYPADHIELFEHDSLAWPGSQEEVWDRLDQLIADVLDATGADQVNLLGHSQGTGVVQGYLNSDPARAAEVAQYVNLDGGSGGTVPDEIETLAIWGEGSPDREIPGATNVQFADQAHTEVVNSSETFVEIYRFFTGEEPPFQHVVREPADEIVVSGRVQLFPQNVGATDATLGIHEIDPETGARIDDSPVAIFELSGDGSWGPFDADGDAFYEFAITRDTGVHHVYPQRFVRSSRWVRILTSEPGGLADSFWEVGDDHTNLVILRNKEWWGDQGADGDSLEINGESILNEATSPRSNRTIGIFVHDDGTDGVSDLSEPVAPFGVNFLTGVDLHIPAADPPDGTVGVVATPRLGDGTESVCIPNWPSSTDRSSIQMSSYHLLLGPDGSPAAGHASPDCATPAERPPTEPPGAPSDRVAAPATPVSAQPSFTG